MATHGTIPSEIWSSSGTTEHLGGVAATQRLLEACGVESGQVVLDLGCGTGYTACILAGKHGAQVVAVDIRFPGLQEAEQRVASRELAPRVVLVQADAHHLPFRAGAFDAAVAESVLVFCSAAQVAAEIARTLRAGGAFGANELTLLQTPQVELVHLLQETLGIRAVQEAEWRNLLEEAGFRQISSQVQNFRWREQMAGHLAADGVRGYISAMVRGLANVKASRVFLNRRMLRTARLFAPIVGYGLYTGRKP
jgi:ubiquinone/menaquinone biosynthesis C-methylase UbiE